LRLERRKFTRSAAVAPPATGILSAVSPRLPATLPAGLLLVAVCWPLNWLLEGLRTHLLFFPLWLGYVLAVDGWTLWRTGTSQLARSRRLFVGSFLISVPCWWLFEAFNLRLRNWEYVGRASFSDLEYFLLASLSFSTVTPAVLGTAELLRSFRGFERFRDGPRLRPGPRLDLGLALAGAAMLAAMLVWPRHCFPFAWTSLVLLLEPIARLFGRRTLLDDLRHGDWRPWWSLWAAGLVCGFFWEMWNEWSYPKWIYHIPHVGFAKVFEMPALGYLGYLPFALELHLLRSLLVRGSR
jgi:hypothetical protein